MSLLATAFGVAMPTVVDASLFNPENPDVESRRSMNPMTSLTIELDDDAAEELRRRARREGVEPAELAARLVVEATSEQNPFGFVGSFESDVVGARDTNAFLAEHGFGSR